MKQAAPPRILVTQPLHTPVLEYLQGFATVEMNRDPSPGRPRNCEPARPAPTGC